MGKIKDTLIESSGEDVVKAIGELSATTEQAVKAASEAINDEEEVKGVLKIIFKAIVDFLK